MPRQRAAESVACAICVQISSLLLLLLLLLPPPPPPPPPPLSR
jgi:hypothetical protein